MSDLNLYWGELHNHNELGYAQGSLERSYEIARSHLDFYAFTPHGLHADGGVPDGYPVVVANWERIRRAASENNRPGEFTCFPAYEWHSSAWGHLHVLSAEDMESMYCARNLADLQDHFRNRQAILVPHHTAYERGVDWEGFDEALSPVVEIFSEHGSSERDSGLYPMLGHSGGPAGYQYTVQHGLALGKRFGLVAGTDNHDGYPGGYGLGLTGIWAKENSRAALFDALQKRRTTAVTGDRIEVCFRAGEAWMGEVVSGPAERRLDYRVEGWDALKSVEVVRDNLPVHIEVPDYSTPRTGQPQPYRLRFEWGWGPMKGYQVYDWQGRLQVEGGRLLQVVPCFSSDPFDEVRRKRVLEWDEKRCAWQSHTSRGFCLHHPQWLHSAKGQRRPVRGGGGDRRDAGRTRIRLPHQQEPVGHGHRLVAHGQTRRFPGQLQHRRAFTGAPGLARRWAAHLDRGPPGLARGALRPKRPLYRPERDAGLLLSARHPRKRPVGLEQSHLV